MPGFDPAPAAHPSDGGLPRRTPGGTDLRIFTNNLPLPGRHRRDRLLLLRPWSTARYIGASLPVATD